MGGPVQFRLETWLLTIAGLGLLAAVGIVVLRASAVENGAPLSGVQAHDFGIVELGEVASQLQHTFVLRNQSKRTLRIQKIATTCGCTDASADVDVVPPGAIVRVSASLFLSDSGSKEAQVLLYTDHERQRRVVLTLHATGRFAKQVTVIDRNVTVQAGRSASITMFAIDYKSDQVPRDPQVFVSDGLTATFEGWRIVHPRHKASGHPARWEGRVNVSASPLTSGDRSSSVTLSCEGSPPISIPVLIRNGRNSPSAPS